MKDVSQCVVVQSVLAAPGIATVTWKTTAGITGVSGPIAIFGAFKNSDVCNLYRFIFWTNFTSH